MFFFARTQQRRGSPVVLFQIRGTSRASRAGWFRTARPMDLYIVLQKNRCVKDFRKTRQDLREQKLFCRIRKSACRVEKAE
jgi:hypothetical protein